MNIKNIHINLLFLILAIFSLQSVAFDSIPNRILFLETEIEETTDDIIELDYEKQLSDSDSDGGNNAIISNQSFHFLSPFSQNKIANKNSKDLPNKTHLFILYCRLKLDC